MIAIAQHVHSFDKLDRMLAFEAFSDDPEHYDRCVARERANEIAICAEMGVPCFLILDGPRGRNVRISGHGGQNPFGAMSVCDANRHPVETLKPYRVLLRTSGTYEKGALKLIRQLGGLNIAGWQSQKDTRHWYKRVKKEFLKRRVGWFPLETALVADLGAFRDHNGEFFCKTDCKIRGGTGVTSSVLELFGYDVERMSAQTEVIVSERLDLMADSGGKLEYRIYVVNGKVSSISRYIDYVTDYEIPRSVAAFAGSFVEAHLTELPSCYVLDVGECRARGPVVIELNGIVASGRYEKNCFRKLLADLV